MEEAKFLKFLWQENIGYVTYTLAVYGVTLLMFWLLV